ncbi:hypothetical protein EMIHUDRAFT_210842 [Emiliania huxleyi CCMP1516]|uniref:Uncharacterized protein n=2 Tax=Emiliania huxleyi TaxID=2903 RepID=A0A0D3IXD4_EMIH1|nr:hypothetical protein EMIHUDRAFT_210842 [Emiliania huxleyi CCMP1516]EOD15919.1 hypothetical protein EMIHUDRAFT_210842 [Emiliania huxleyi CCMP1516]|eukprot:XP_005768348.1 hypothetical protein EMIHUDRAFT_210842 [Emiliania huxleyi CCMP1516]
MAGPTCGGFDLSSAVGVGGLTAAAGIAIRSASCQQPRVAALVGAAAAIGLCAVASVFCSHALAARGLCAKKDTCSCKQCENLEPLLAEVERLSVARAKGKKGKKKKKNVGVGDAGAARLNEEMLCS